MINLSKIFLEKKLSYYTNKKNKLELEKYLLNCKNPKSVIDTLDIYSLCELDVKVYARPVEGFYNLYDYILKSKNEPISAKTIDNNNPAIYIPWIMNRKTCPKTKITSDILLDKLPNGQIIAEYLIENNDFGINEIIVDTMDLAKILYQHEQYNTLANCTPNLYNQELFPGKTVLDFLKEKNILPNINYIDNNSSFSDIYNNLFGDLMQNILLNKVDGKTVLELLIDKDFSFNITFTNEIKENDWQEITKILLAKKRLDLIKTVPQSYLQLQIENNQTNTNNKVFNRLYGEKIFPKIIGPINDPEIIMRYVHGGKAEEIIDNITLEAFTKKVNSNNFTVLDFILYDYILKKQSFKNVLMLLNNKHYLTPEVTVCLAKYNIFLPSNYQKETGLKKDNELIDYIYPKEKYDYDSKSAELIEEFYQAFNDQESNQDILDLVITSFKRSYNIDKDLAIRDLKALIALKEEYPQFTLKYDATKESYFRPPIYPSPCICLNNKNDLECLNHEWGHALHFICSNNETPPEFNEFDEEPDITSARKALQTINNEANELLLKDADYQKEFVNYIMQFKGGKIPYLNEIKKEFRQLFGTEKLLLEAMNDTNYSKELLTAIANAYYDHQDAVEGEKLIGDYVKNRVKAERKFFKDEMYRKSNANFLCYENFIDAYYNGMLGSLISMLSKEVELKTPFCAHNYSYFTQNDNKFKEMLANYVQLKKSPDGTKFIDKLRQKTSPKLIDFLEKYYHELDYSKNLTRQEDNALYA